MNEGIAPGTPDLPPGRPFGLIDGLIVLAGAGVAFSILWDLSSLYQHLLMIVASVGDWTSDQFFRNWCQLTQGVSSLLACLLCVSSATILVLNLRYPRPPLEDLACRPGFMASATVMLILVPHALVSVKTLVIMQLAYPRGGVTYLDPRQLLLNLLMTMPFFTGATVLASWLTLLLNRRWIPRPTWLDRAGRAVGWAWLIVALL